MKMGGDLKMGRSIIKKIEANGVEGEPLRPDRTLAIFDAPVIDTP